MGFVIAVLLVYFVGFFLASFIGRSIWRMLETLLVRVPLVKAVYPAVKQITDFLFREQHFKEYTLVVAVQYPRKGVWSSGLVTGPPLRSIQSGTPEELVTISVPSSPTPFTGYVISAPRADVVETPLSIEEAFRFVVSGGVVRPPHQTADFTRTERADTGASAGESNSRAAREPQARRLERG